MLLNVSLYQRKYSKLPFCKLREEKRHISIYLEKGYSREGLLISAQLPTAHCPLSSQQQDI